MKKPIIIEIDGFRGELVINYKTFRILAEMKGLAGVQAVFDLFAEMEGREIDIFVELITAAIIAKHGYEHPCANVDEVGGWVLKNTHRMPELVAALQAVLPQPQTDTDDPGKIAALPVTEAQTVNP